MTSEQSSKPYPDPAELRRNAGEIYKRVQEAGGLHSLRTIAITDVANGDVDSNDEGLVVWRETEQTLDFSKYKGINLPIGYQWYHDLFEEEILADGFIVFKKHGLKPRGSTEELLVTFQDGSYQGARYDSVRKIPQPVDVSRSDYEELLKVIEKIDVLCAIPQMIVDQFGSYDQFLHFLIKELGGQPQPGIVTSNHAGPLPTTIYGEYDETNLPMLVKSLTATEKRKRREKKMSTVQVKPSTQYL